MNPYLIIVLATVIPIAVAAVFYRRVSAELGQVVIEDLHEVKR